MSKDNLKGILTLSIISVFGALVLIFFSVSFGRSLAEDWLIKQGGADTGLYLLITEKYIDGFLITGSILLFVSLVLCVVTYFMYSTLLNDNAEKIENEK